jgi:hypothetical protein
VATRAGVCSADDRAAFDSVRHRLDRRAVPLEQECAAKCAAAARVLHGVADQHQACSPTHRDAATNGAVTEPEEVGRLGHDGTANRCLIDEHPSAGLNPHGPDRVLAALSVTRPAGLLMGGSPCWLLKLVPLGMVDRSKATEREQRPSSVPLSAGAASPST